MWWGRVGARKLWGRGGELCARAAGVDGRALRAEREARRSGNVAKQ